MVLRHLSVVLHSAIHGNRCAIVVRDPWHTERALGVSGAAGQQDESMFVVGLETMQAV